MAQIGNVKFETQNNGTISLPVFDIGDSNSGVHEFVRVQTSNGTGFIPLADPGDASYPYVRVKTASRGIVAFHNETSLGIQNLITNGLEHRWKFDNSSNDTAFDTFGNRNGTLKRGARKTENSKQGSRAVSIDGAEDRVDIDNFTFDGGAFTITSWINPDRQGDDRIYSFLGSTIDNIDIGVKGTSDTLNVSWSNSGFDVTGGFKIRSDLWQHHALTYDSNGGVEVYWNGKRRGTGSVGSNNPNNTATLQIGVGKRGGPHSEADFDDIRYYDRVLSSSEIEDISNLNG